MDRPWTSQASTLAFLSVLVLASLAAAGCSQFRASDARITEDLAEMDLSPRIEYLHSGDRTIRYMVVGSDKLPRVLFIHGAPGSLDAFNPYFEREDLRDAFQLVSVDRPGYGYSDFGQTEPDLGVQAQLISPLVTPGTIVVGHSFGGTVAMRLAMQKPDEVAGAVLVAASLSPEHEKPYWFNRPMERRALNWLLPAAWKVANTERLLQRENLEAMLPLWPRVTMPVHLIHGSRDRMVPVAHSHTALARLPEDSATLEVLEGERHFILWSEVDRVAAAIMALRRPD